MLSIALFVREANKRVCMVFAFEKRKQHEAVKEERCVSEGERVKLMVV